MNTLKNIVKLVFVACLFLIPFQTTQASTLIKNPIEAEQTVSIPKSIYTTQSNSFSTAKYAIPPSQIHYTILYKNGYTYAGYLPRTSYANTGDMWIVYYGGYLYLK